MRNICRNIGLLIFLNLVCAQVAFARKPIQVDVTIGAQTSTAGFNSIESMIKSFEENPEAYYGTGFDLTDPAIFYDATIDILGFKMTINTSLVADPDNPVLLTLSFTGSDGSAITYEIRGANRASVYSQLEDFFESDSGKEIFNEYVKAMQSQAVFNWISGAQSPVGESVRENTMRAMGESMTLSEMKRYNKEGGNFSIGYEHTTFENEYFKGESTTIPIQMGSRLNQTADIQFRIPLNWTDLDGTEFYRIGMELDLGIKLSGHQPLAPFEWEITPTVGNYVLGTADLMVGGDIYNYGVQNRFQWNTQASSLSYGVYWGQYKSSEVSLGDIDVDLQVDEQIISHGLKLAFRMGQHGVFDVYAIQSRPEDGIGYREVKTIGATFNLRMGGAILQIGYAQDEGEDHENAKYEAERWLANLLFRF